MARPGSLSNDEIARRLTALPGWTVEQGRLHRSFAFKDFVEAFAFMTDLAREAEGMSHHPEWSNVYNRVTIDLITHDAQGITVLDFELARKAQDLAARRARP